MRERKKKSLRKAALVSEAAWDVLAWGESTPDGTWLPAPQGPSSSAQPVTQGPNTGPPGCGWNCPARAPPPPAAAPSWATGAQVSAVPCGVWLRPTARPAGGNEAATGRGAVKAEGPWEQAGHQASPSAAAPDGAESEGEHDLGTGPAGSRFPGRGRKGVWNEGDRPASEAQTWKASVREEAAGDPGEAAAVQPRGWQVCSGPEHLPSLGRQHLGEGRDGRVRGSGPAFTCKEMQLKTGRDVRRHPCGLGRVFFKSDKTVCAGSCRRHGRAPRRGW